MDNEISEFRVRTLKFDDNYDDKIRAVDDEKEPLGKKSSAQNCVKVFDKQPEVSQAYKIVAGQTYYRTERNRSPDNQVDEKCLKQVQGHQSSLVKQNKPRNTVYQFPIKGKIFTSVGVGIAKV